MKTVRIVLAAGMAVSMAMMAMAQTNKPAEVKPTQPATTTKTPAAAQPATTTKAPAHTPAAAPTTPDTAQPTDPANMTPEQMMQAWDAANPITEEHHHLAMGMAGEWSTVTECWFSPNTPPTKCVGTAKFTVVPGLKGRFVSQDFGGDFMGKPFKGLGFFGYNTASGKFESIWMDSSSNGMQMETGTKDGSNVIDFHGTATDPFTKQAKPTHSRMTHKDASTISYEMFEQGADGKEFRSMAITYTRNAPKTIPGTETTKKAEPSK